MRSKMEFLALLFLVFSAGFLIGILISKAPKEKDEVIESETVESAFGISAQAFLRLPLKDIIEKYGSLNLLLVYQTASGEQIVPVLVVIGKPTHSAVEVLEGE